MSFNLKDCKNVLIIGAGHGIGCALVREIFALNSSIHIFASYRITSRAGELIELKEQNPENLSLFNFDPTKDTSLKELSIDLKSKEVELDLIINCVGLLHGEDLSPEKSLRTFNVQDFLEVMMVNACVTPLLAKNFESLLTKNRTSALVTISAKVGSIEDNQMGGWYSYRASKAALNMLIKNIAIEFSRKKKDCLVLAIHPGTTKTELSAPFIKNTKYKLHTPEETAVNILNVIQNREHISTGKFYSWNGEEIPW